MLRSVSLVLAVVLVFVTSVPVSAETVLESADLSSNGRADTWVVDINGDGRGDQLRVDGDESGVAEVILLWAPNGLVSGIWMDANLDNVWDTVIEPRYTSNGAMAEKMLYRDADQNGRWENVYFDGQLDNYYEWVMVDGDYDGSADTWVGNSASAGRSATDELARQVASIEAVNILHTAGLSVFFPTVSVPPGG